MHYEAVPEPREPVERILSRGNVAELRLLPLSVSLHSVDPEQAEAVCLQLATHGDAITRGNAILGLGHIARIHRRLKQDAARPVVEAALRDPADWVRGQATSAADDLEQFLGWSLDRP